MWNFLFVSFVWNKNRERLQSSYSAILLSKKLPNHVETNLSKTITHTVNIIFHPLKIQIRMKEQSNIRLAQLELFNVRFTMATNMLGVYCVFSYPILWVNDICTKIQQLFFHNTLKWLKRRWQNRKRKKRKLNKLRPCGLKWKRKGNIIPTLFIIPRTTKWWGFFL